MLPSLRWASTGCQLYLVEQCRGCTAKQGGSLGRPLRAKHCCHAALPQGCRCRRQQLADTVHLRHCIRACHEGGRIAEAAAPQQLCGKAGWRHNSGGGGGGAGEVARRRPCPTSLAQRSGCQPPGCTACRAATLAGRQQRDCGSPTSKLLRGASAHQRT